VTNFTIGLFNLEILKSEQFDSGISHYFTYFVAIIPPGKPYTGLETLLLPFKNTLWIAIACSFAIELVIVFFVNRVKHQGRVKTPIIQLYASWIGNVLTPEPKTLLGRSLMVMFIFQSLVLRSVYQGKLYDNMRHMCNKSHIQTYEEAVEEGFNFFLPKEAAIFLETMPEVLARYNDRFH
jgi:hypothetical protein